MHNQQIKDSILTKMEDCDVLICLVGKETYTRGHVDWEIHKALKGGIYNRKGIVALLLENRGDSIYNLDWSTFPNRLQDNMDYIVLEQFASFHSRIDDDLNEAVSISKDNNYIVNNNRQLMELRHKYYYDNF